MANTLTAALRYSEYWKPANELKLQHEENNFPSLHIKELEAILPAGLQRGIIAEIWGARSSGRTSVSLRILAEATDHGEICAVVDLQDNFHPISTAAAGVRLEQIVWIRCGGNVEYAMRATDLLLHAGGFGVIGLDLCDAAPKRLHKIPLSYWHRFRRVIENTSTTLLVWGDSTQARSCASQSLHIKHKAISWSGTKPFCSLNGLESYATPGKVSSIRPCSLFFHPAA
jgi:recA bacterial DNA recombination protein